MATRRAIAEKYLYDCENCKKRFTKAQRLEVRGCQGKHGAGIIEDVLFHTCPANYNTDAAAYALSLHSFFKQGFLPFPGTVTEQPAQIIEIFNLVSSLESKEAQAEMKKRARNGR